MYFKRNLKSLVSDVKVIWLLSDCCETRRVYLRMSVLSATSLGRKITLKPRWEGFSCGTFMQILFGLEGICTYLIWLHHPPTWRTAHRSHKLCFFMARLVSI